MTNLKAWLICTGVFATLLICWLFIASLQQALLDKQTICGTVTNTLVAGGWRLADEVFYDVSWEDGTQTREKDFPETAPLKGNRTCKEILILK